MHVCDDFVVLREETEQYNKAGLSGKKESKSSPTLLAKGFQAIVVTIAKITLDHDEVQA